MSRSHLARTTNVGVHDTRVEGSVQKTQWACEPGAGEIPVSVHQLDSLSIYLYFRPWSFCRQYQAQAAVACGALGYIEGSVQKTQWACEPGAGEIPVSVHQLDSLSIYLYFRPWSFCRQCQAQAAVACGDTRGG